jgi:hypothetical protein
LAPFLITYHGEASECDCLSNAWRSCTRLVGRKAPNTGISYLYDSDAALTVLSSRVTRRGLIRASATLTMLVRYARNTNAVPGLDTSSPAEGHHFRYHTRLSAVTRGGVGIHLQVAIPKESALITCTAMKQKHTHTHAHTRAHDPPRNHQVLRISVPLLLVLVVLILDAVAWLFAASPSLILAQAL